MGAYITNNFFKQTILTFAGLPLLIWAMGNAPERTLLKEALSLITILSFFQMIGQFFWARTNKSAVADLKMSKVIKYHKIMGYTFVIILLFHPVFLFVPRFLEAGIDPADAFITTITTFTSQGVVLGIIAWSLLIILGITSFVRKKLPMEYKTWRVFHGILAILFVSVAAWHAIDLGRHSSFPMSLLIISTGVCGILLLMKAYTFKSIKKTEEV
ncbi:putative FAD/NAD(P)-binding:oxidoreductase [Desulforapulum autotrophicum HRM2]|uniref:FAD/NAD(P)-binding:oxidoreductase n=1 Tax=Desulforapulum autotrophicum (strain ATCC 43914 / DSM 3382 / VKM B-1955 / HRM2) TaxID=177437 RepID=C0QEC2_DESAH|nr:ferric reductase-like transmembrane domain-containing protein [Desulforapulum autotrophicum]ACN13239.1 putative FAD/NAD(P)-binding:oxidoreductase [Desulforapulum autotrophicum HRM2]